LGACWSCKPKPIFHLACAATLIEKLALRGLALHALVMTDGARFRFSVLLLAHISLGRCGMTQVIKQPKPEIGLEHLESIVTVTEACILWQRGRTSIKFAIDRGYLTARRVGRDWLISVPSLIAHYGETTRKIRR
jgi:hypothetical protein